MKLIYKALIYAFVVLLFLLNFMSCASQNPNLIEGNTLVTVEYDGEVELEECYPKVPCINVDRVQCIYNHHAAAKEAIKRSIAIAKRSRNLSLIKTEFSLALCYLFEADDLIIKLRSLDKKSWDSLNKSGFIRNVRLTGLILHDKIQELEEILKNQ
mgnify:CR=1 FL=1